MLFLFKHGLKLWYIALKYYGIIIEIDSIFKCIFGLKDMLHFVFLCYKLIFITITAVIWLTIVPFLRQIVDKMSDTLFGGHK